MKERRVTIVDDEPSMRNLLRDFLLSQGYQVELYASGAEALKSLNETAKELPFAVIAHVRMHPMNGLDLLANVRREHPEVPVFLFSGAGNPDEKITALKLGAAQYLAKPFSLTVLRALLNDLTVPDALPQARM